MTSHQRSILRQMIEDVYRHERDLVRLRYEAALSVSAVCERVYPNVSPFWYCDSYWMVCEHTPATHAYKAKRLLETRCKHAARSREYVRRNNERQKVKT